MEVKIKKNCYKLLSELSEEIQKMQDALLFNVDENYINNSLLEFCIYVIIIVDGFNERNIEKVNYWTHRKFEVKELTKEVKNNSFFKNEIPLYLKHLIIFDYHNNLNGSLFVGITKLFSEIGYEFISMDKNGLRVLNDYKNFINRIKKYGENNNEILKSSSKEELSNNIFDKILMQKLFNDKNTIDYICSDEYEKEKIEITNNIDSEKKIQNIIDDKKQVDYDQVNSCIEELNKYIGLNRVKQEIKELVSLIEIRNLREKKGLKNPSMSYHLCFLGNPGTGKTTVARILAKIYKSLGIIKNDNLVEVGRQDLVGGYVGQTAIKTKSVIRRAYGGILFIDEAYSLTNKGNENDYGLEAIEVILKEMEDNRDNLVVIVAGYSDLMQDFLNSNPGLKSRFNTFINFDDYSPNELLQILTMICKDNDYHFECKKEILKYFKMKCENKGKDFSNARFVRNLFENAIKKQAIRLSNLSDITKIDINEIVLDDFNLMEDM